MEASNADFVFPFPAGSGTPYTPSKECSTLEYTPYQTPADRAAASASSAASPVTASPAASLAGGLSSPEPYTPTKPGYRIRKRKPIPDRYNLKGTKYEGMDNCDERKDLKDIKPVSEMLMMSPGKSILLKDRLARSKTRRSVNFSDEKGLPLVAVQEIPARSTGETTSDDEDAEQKRRKQLESDKPPLRLVKCHSPDRKSCQSVSETAITERKRIHDKGILTGPIFGIVELEDDPKLSQLAAEALGHVVPRIPLHHISTTRGSLIRDLPLPGRKQVETSSPLDITQEQLDKCVRYTPSPVEETVVVQQQSTSESKMEIVQLTEPPVTEYYATTSFAAAGKTIDTSAKSLSSLIGSLSSVAKSLLSSKAAAQKVSDSVGQPMEEESPSTSEAQATFYVGRVYAENDQQQNVNGSGPSNPQSFSQYQKLQEQEYAYYGQYKSQGSSPQSLGVSNTNQQQYQQNGSTRQRKSRFSPPLHENSNTNYYKKQQHGHSGPRQSRFEPPVNGTLNTNPQQKQQNPLDGMTVEEQQKLTEQMITGNRFVQGQFKYKTPCTYFVVKEDGCNRGDSCKYTHDIEMREEQRKIREQQQRSSPQFANQMRGNAMGRRAPQGRSGPRDGRFNPINRPPPRDRRYFDQRNNDRGANDRPNHNRRTRFDRSPGSNSPPDTN